MKKLGFGKLLLLGAALLATSCASPSSTSKDTVKVGLICLHDSSSTYDRNFIDSMGVAVSHLEGIVEGAPVIMTDVDESNECFTAAKELVRKGCDVVFADSFGHEDFLMQAAQEYPNVTFCHATGTKAKVAGIKNYHNAFASIYEGRYLAGYAAGLRLQSMIANNELEAANYDEAGNIRLGYIGAFPYAEVVSGYTAWYLGVKEAVSNVVMDVTFTSSWYNYDAEMAGVVVLANRGAAIISQHADSMGAPGECESRGIPNITYNVSTENECPNTYVAYSKIDWAPYYEAVIKAIAENRAIEGEVNNNYTGTLHTGSVKYEAKDPTAQAALDAMKDELVAGTRKVFDCSKFTVNGEHLTSYLADVDDMGDFQPETEAIKTENGITFFNESAMRSAPYFDLNIDGINKLN